MDTNIHVELAGSQPRTFSAWQNRNVQLYMLGMFVSQAGTTMQVLAQSWLVYQLTNSPFQLGLVGFIAAVPLAPWSLIVGTISDRVSRRKLLAMALVGETILPLILAALAWSGYAQVWHVVVISLLSGAFGTVDFTSRMPLIQSMVKPEEVESGFAKAVSFMNIARIVGPAAGGILIATIGVAGAFAFNGFSFLFILVMLGLMRIPDRPQPQVHGSLAASLVEAPLYVLRNRLMLIFISMVFLGSFFIMPTLTLLPVFARDILEAGPQGLGFLSASSGVGAVVAGALLAIQPPMTLRRRLLMALGLILALAPVTVAFAFSRNLILSALLLALINGGFVAFRVVSFTHAYVQTPDRMRGRITSVLQIGISSTRSVGGVVGGLVASLLSAPMSVALGGLMCLLLGLAAVGLLVPQLGALKATPEESSTASDLVQRAIE